MTEFRDQKITHGFSVVDDIGHDWIQRTVELPGPGNIFNEHLKTESHRIQVDVRQPVHVIEARCKGGTRSGVEEGEDLRIVNCVDRIDFIAFLQSALRKLLQRLESLWLALTAERIDLQRLALLKTLLNVSLLHTLNSEGRELSRHIGPFVLVSIDAFFAVLF